MQLLLAQLGRIERSIEALPSLLARLDALTESTRQLEAQWRETARELAGRDDTQQRSIADIGLRQSELLAALTALSSTVQEQKAYQVDIGRRVVELERRISACGTNTELEAGVAGLQSEISEWRPWWRGLKWAATILGGLVLTAIGGALLWALVKSGAALP
jgi:hypothetical protein